MYQKVPYYGVQKIQKGFLIVKAKGSLMVDPNTEI